MAAVLLEKDATDAATSVIASHSACAERFCEQAFPFMSFGFRYRTGSTYLRLLVDDKEMPELESRYCSGEPVFV